MRSTFKINAALLLLTAMTTAPLARGASASSSDDDDGSAPAEAEQAHAKRYVKIRAPWSVAPSVSGATVGLTLTGAGGPAEMYMPTATSTQLGLGLGYKDYGLSVSETLTAKDPSSILGSGSGSDIHVVRSLRALRLEAWWQYYKGFYLANPVQQATTAEVWRPSMALKRVQVEATYFPFSDTLSVPALDAGDERQVRPGWSPYVGASLEQLTMTNGGPVLANLQDPAARSELQGAAATSEIVSAGLAGSVPLGGWTFSGTTAVGVGLQSGTYDFGSDAESRRHVVLRRSGLLRADHMYLDTRFGFDAAISEDDGAFGDVKYQSVSMAMRAYLTVYLGG